MVDLLNAMEAARKDERTTKPAALRPSSFSFLITKLPIITPDAKPITPLIALKKWTNEFKKSVNTLSDETAVALLTDVNLELVLWNSELIFDVFW